MALKGFGETGKMVSPALGLVSTLSAVYTVDTLCSRQT